MLTTGNKNYKAKAADVTAGRFIMGDTTNGAGYALHTSGRTSRPFGVATANAESDNEELIAYEPLKTGVYIEAYASEAIALGELVGCDAAGVAVDADLTTNSIVGTCVKACSGSDYVGFIVDLGLGAVV